MRNLIRDVMTYAVFKSCIKDSLIMEWHCNEFLFSTAELIFGFMSPTVLRQNLIITKLLVMSFHCSVIIYLVCFEILTRVVVLSVKSVSTRTTELAFGKWWSECWCW